MLRYTFAPAAAAALAALLSHAQAAPRPQAGDPAAIPLQEGKMIFETLCSACHSLGMPPRLAPPMSHVAMHYREAFPEREQAVARIAAWVKAPAAERSVLPKAALDRWGVMPPLALPDAQLRAVAAYVWTLADSAGTMQHGAEHGHGNHGGHGPPRPPTP